MLIEYIWEWKNGRRQKKGVLVGDKIDDDVVCIGFSLCSPNDKFDKYFGFDIAIERALKFRTRTPKNVPFSIKNKLPKFIDRCRRYFKTDKFPSWLESFIK